jgi:hypothetical protein
MVCATPRSPPSIEYLLLDAHPIKMIGYTFILIIISIKMAEKEKKLLSKNVGGVSHTQRTKNRLNLGPAKNISL